ncbi:MAG: helix-turn-helix transcriptional regulator [Chloroflexota bacterium]|nr:MAG: helix-turn-helix transcriptional regulator [Chloroflexota bacterium]
MPAPILATKLYIPPPRSKSVRRPRLIERLDAGLERKLTLISAPAGFGKTTLVTEWIAGCKRPVAWLSLDEGDNDLTRFLTYLVAALQTIAPRIGDSIFVALQSPQPPPSETLLTALLNEIAAIPDHFILVLDDYHMLDSEPIDHALTFLLDHLPPQMHLVITTREDPSLPLPRYRVRGQLTELRAADLRFTPVEAAEFLNRMMGLNLRDTDIVALEARTEGWIAGLQLAALALQGFSMQGRSDTAGFIQAFTGSHRFVLDYLAGDVLERQPERVRNFLLHTAILDRLSGSLCDAVTVQEGSRAMLETLERANLFVVPLDDQRQWYRYHHLFADVLLAHLRETQPDLVFTFHRRASVWFEQNDLPADAIRHALAAEDFGRAAEMVELVFPAMNRSRQFATLLGWLKALPDELVRHRPVLSTEYALVSMSCGENESVEPRLRDAERCLDPVDPKADRYARSEAPAAGMVVVDKDEFRRVPGMIALIRAGQALSRGDLPETVKHARRVLDLASEDDYLMLGGAASQLGLVAWANGDLDTAHQMTADGLANVRLAGYISPAIGGSIVLADIQIAQGRLREAMTTYEQALQWAMAPGAPVLPGAADMYVGMSNLHYEWNDLKTATQHLLTSQALGDLAGLPQNPYRWRAAMARIRQAQGDLDGALDLLDQAERLYEGNFSPNVRPLAARKTRVWVAQGRLGKALGWAREQGLTVENELTYLHEFDHITLARVLLARYLSDGADGSISEGLGLLERLLKAAQEGGRLGSVIEILVLQAMAYHAQGDLPAALLPLQHALALAEPEDYVRMFLDEGPGMLQLLAAVRRLPEASTPEIMPWQGLPAYTNKLLAAFEAEQKRSVGESPLPDWQSQSFPALQPMIEPLSQRELEVLRLFKTELSGPEIARQLVISLSTVRTHSKRIYSKLNVNNRRAAVKRATERDLI